MARLDAEEAGLRQPTEKERLTPPEIVEYLRSLPVLWLESGPAGRQAIAVAIFSRLEGAGLPADGVRTHARMRSISASMQRFRA